MLSVNPMASRLSRLFSLRLVVVILAVAFATAGDRLGLPGLVEQVLFNLLVQTEAGMPAPDNLDLALAAHGLSEPLWSVLAVQLGMLAVTLYLVLLVPRTGMAVALPLTLLLVGGLVVVQGTLVFYHRLWLPLGDVAALLVTGFVIMLFWLQPNRQIQALRENVREARLRLGRLLLQQGQTDEVLEVLAACPVCPEALDLRYETAILQEQKRQYRKAAGTYRSILQHRKGFRDARERLQALDKLAPAPSAMAANSMDDSRTLLVPERAISRPTLGRYEVEREIGRGAMGVVYLGKDPKISRTVAIKTLSYQAFEPARLAELKERFFREAEAAGRLSHPAIVTVYDVGEEADLAYIAMDYAPGRALSDFGKPGRLLPLPKVLDIVARVADALAYAHGQGIVHRDIKPGNLIYNPDTGAVKITDFGIARITDDSRTRTGSVMGSPLYMSPEQLRGQKVTGASDIYSLGITLYKLVTGETPYRGDTLASLTYQILNGKPRSVRQFNDKVPTSVVRLINRAIQKEPEKRFASAATMAEAVRRLMQREAREA